MSVYGFKRKAGARESLLSYVNLSSQPHGMVFMQFVAHSAKCNLDSISVLFCCLHGIEKQNDFQALADYNRSSHVPFAGPEFSLHFATLYKAAEAVSQVKRKKVRRPL